MNIDDLANFIADTSSDKEVCNLVELVKGWKTDDSTVAELSERVERHIGQVWFSSDALHERIYSAWQSFKTEAILNIGGMTMNERLHFFGLSSRCDSATEQDRGTVYAKLHAQR